MAGRKPHPYWYRELTGNRSRTPMKDNVMKPEKKAPACPKHIKGMARKEWRRVVKELDAVGALSRVNRGPLEAYCEAYATWFEANEKLKEDKVKVYKTSKGYPVVTSWMYIRRDAVAEMKWFWSEFGATPAAMTRVKVAPKKTEDPFDKFKNRRKTAA